MFAIWLCLSSQILNISGIDKLFIIIILSTTTFGIGLLWWTVKKVSDQVKETTDETEKKVVALGESLMYCTSLIYSTVTLDIMKLDNYIIVDNEETVRTWLSISLIIFKSALRHILKPTGCCACYFLLRAAGSAGATGATRATRPQEPQGPANPFAAHPLIQRNTWRKEARHGNKRKRQQKSLGCGQCVWSSLSELL